VIDTVISQLRERLFYLSDEGLYFMNQPNLNKILLTREENIAPDAIIEEERRLIERHISRKTNFRTYIWPRAHRDVPDTSDLKLLILKKAEADRDFIEKRGESPRVYRNTMIFLCVDENQKESFCDFIRRILALKSIETDKSLNLTEGQLLPGGRSCTSPS